MIHVHISMIYVHISMIYVHRSVSTDLWSMMYSNQNIIVYYYKLPTLIVTWRCEARSSVSPDTNCETGAFLPLPSRSCQTLEWIMSSQSSACLDVSQRTRSHRHMVALSQTHTMTLPSRLRVVWRMAQVHLGWESTVHLGQTSETVGGGNRGLSWNQTTGADTCAFKNSCFEFSILHSFSPLLWYLQSKCCNNLCDTGRVIWQKQTNMYENDLGWCFIIVNLLSFKSPLKIWGRYWCRCHFVRLMSSEDLPPQHRHFLCLCIIDVLSYVLPFISGVRPQSCSSLKPCFY